MKRIALSCALWFGLVIQIVPTMAHAAAHSADPLPLDQYWRRVDAAAALLEGADPDVVAVTAAVEDLASVEAVQLPDGQVLPVDSSELAALLRDGDVAMVRARLVALQRSRDVSTGRRALATDGTFVQLEEILARPEFAEATETDAAPSALERALDGLVQKLFDWLGNVIAVPGVRFMLSALGVVAVSAILIYAFRGALSQWVVEGRVKGDGVMGDARDLSSDEALERAHTVAAGGDYRQAVRYLYLSTLLWLDERRLLRYDPALTNREFLRQIAQSGRGGGLHEALAPIVDLFDRVWYGFAPLDSRGYAAYARQVEQVRRVDGAR